MVKESQRSSQVLEGPSNSNLESSESKKSSITERKANFKSAHRKPGGVKKIKFKKDRSSPALVQIKKKRRRPVKGTVEGLTGKAKFVSPRQQFAIFKPPPVRDVTATMHPTQKEADIQEYQEEPILKIQVERIVGENGVNGKNEHVEPIIPIENDVKEKNGHHFHDVIDHEEEIVDVVAISETDLTPLVPEAEEAPVCEDNSNGVPEEPVLLSPRVRGSAKKGSTSSRSSSPADSLHKERASRKLNYQPAQVPLEEKLEVSEVADLDEPLEVEGPAEDLEVSAAVSVEKSPVKPRTPAKTSSPGRPKKSLHLPSTPVVEEPVEPVSGRRGRKPRSDEKKKLEENASPRASMSLLEDVEDYQPLPGRAGSGIRSVRARRPIRRSRNMSALDSSLHNQSSPWDEEYKILSPRGGNASLVVDSSLVNGDNGDESLLSVSVAQKRKVSDDELDAKDLKKPKNESSHTSSFFSIVTSPICALKERFRGGALSSSTPFHGPERKPAVDSDASMLSADENQDAKPSPVATQEANRWCAIM